jgi:acyl dehydratase
MLSDTLIGSDLGTLDSAWKPDDVILYHLGLGAGSDFTNPAELRYVYERDLVVLPSFSVRFLPPFLQRLMALDGFDVPLSSILHGRHELQIRGSLPVEGSVVSRGRVAELHDKGSSAVIVLEVESATTDGDSVVTNRLHLFARGAGGFSEGRAKGATPDRERTSDDDTIFDEISTLDISSRQAIVYRLSGDKNPLHVDPDMATKAGFDTPILHGLCTFGMVAKVVVDRCADGRVDVLESLSARFSRPVVPGQQLMVGMRRDDAQVRLAVGSPDLRTPVLSDAHAVLRS